MNFKKFKNFYGKKQKNNSKRKKAYSKENEKEEVKLDIKIEITETRTKFVQDLKVEKQKPINKEIENKVKSRDLRKMADDIEDEKRIELWKTAKTIQEER